MDNMRVDGKFLDKDQEIPEGQGICNSLLSECYDILYELQESVVDEGSDNDDNEEEDEIETELRGSKNLDVIVWMTIIIEKEKKKKKNDFVQKTTCSLGNHPAFALASPFCVSFSSCPLVVVMLLDIKMSWGVEGRVVRKW